MANLIVTFGRADGDPPVMYGSGCKTEVLEIAASATDPVVTTAAGSDAAPRLNCVDLYAEAACWVEIGADPVASEPAADPDNKSFFIEEGGRTQRYVLPGQKVSVVAFA